MDPVISLTWSRVLGDPTYLIIAAILTSTLFYVSRAILDPLRDLPGPFLARFSRLWYLKSLNRGQQESAEVQLHKRYGPIVRLAPGQYSFNDISAAKTIYDHASKFPKSDFYAPFGPPGLALANLFQEQNINAHASKKRKLASLYSMTSIVSYEPYVNSNMQTYMSRLDQFASESTAIDLPSWMQFYAFDVIGTITYGDPYGFLAHGCDFTGIIREMYAGASYGAHVGVFAGSWHKYIAALMSKIMKPPFLATQMYAMVCIERKQIALEGGKTFHVKTGQQDIAEKLLSLKAQGKINQAGLLGALRSNIAAGSDTTGITLSAIVYYLLQNPATLAKLRQEIDDHKAKQENPQRFVTFAQAQEMPYLQATIKEALRLHPAVGMQLARVVPDGGATLAGRFFPARTVVGVNPWVIHRNTDLFGEDANQFRPERWLQDEQKSKELDRCLFAFGAGARTCIGKNISLLEMQKLVPELVFRYDFELADAEKEWESINRWFVYRKYDCFVRMRNTKGMQVVG